jgi:energy-coupling factor transport system substrate-specific component
MIRTILVATTAALALAPAAQAGTGAGYLLKHQRPSGGIAEAGTRKASVSLTEWAAMGLRAAGRSPGRARRPGGRTMTTYLAHHASSWRNAFALERGLLAVVAIGKNPRHFADRDLVRALRARVGADGVIGATQNSTYWGVIALRAAGVPAPRRSLAVIHGAQRSNGGYSWSASAAPDADDTSAAVLALRASGASCGSRAVAGAYGYLATAQTSSHGYALLPGGAANSQSTSWAIQARSRCHLSNHRSLAWLHARQLPSGAYNYQPGLTTTPAWVTGQVLPAVNGRAYPIS